MCHSKYSQYQSDEVAGPSQVCEAALPPWTLKGPGRQGGGKLHPVDVTAGSKTQSRDGSRHCLKDSNPFTQHVLPSSISFPPASPPLQHMLSGTPREKNLKKIALIFITKDLWYIKLSNYSNSKDEQRYMGRCQMDLFNKFLENKNIWKVPWSFLGLAILYILLD